jgi:SNF2 family DNA or RNA helicase
MTAPLYKFQSAAVRQIERGEPVYLGFDPGLGKSRTALEAAQRRGAKRILVTCLASGRYVWEEQTRLWSPYRVITVRDVKDLKGEGVFVLTYGLISQQGSPFVEAVASGQPFDMTVLDEAAALKNVGSNRTKAVLGRMLGKLGYVLPLSGTPAPNHAGELYPILKALYPQALKSGTGRDLMQWEFENRYCNVTMKRFAMGGTAVRVIEGSRNLAELRQRIEGFMLRVRKEMVLTDLPSIRYDVVPIGIDPRVGQLPTLGLPADDNALLKYLANNIKDENVMRLRRQLGLCKVNPAIEYIDDFMQNLPEGRKVLVFAHHKEVIERLMSGLQNWSPVKIDGASTPAMRTQAVNTFLTNNKCRIFIGNIQAAGTGFTLVGPTCLCSDVIFVEASYAVGDNVQASARVHRIGQKAAVVARFLTAHKTIDDRIQSILARKAKDFAELFN